MPYLTMLHRARAQLGLSAGEPADDSRLLVCIRAATRAIERAAGRAFVPQIATRPAGPHAPDAVILPGDLLTLTGLSDAGGPIPLERVALIPDAPPHSLIALRPGYAFILDPLDRQVTISGIWGWHDDPAAMWRPGPLSLTAAVTATASSLPITTATGPDSAGETPIVSAGALIRLNAEWLRVTAAAPGLLTVVRGVGGTTASAHSAGTAIAVYQPPADLDQIAAAWAARLYAEARPDLDDLRARLLAMRRETVR